MRGRLDWVPSGEEIIVAAEPFASEGAPPRPSLAGGLMPPRSGESPLTAGQARLLRGSVSAVDVAVSREGHRLAYSQETTDWDIWRLDLQRGRGDRRSADAVHRVDPDRLATLGSPPTTSRWCSPRNAAAASRSGWPTIEGGNLLRLTSFGKDGRPGSPRWSPDGKTIAFDVYASAEGSTGDIYVVSASGGPPRRGHQGLVGRRHAELVEGRTLDLLQLEPERPEAGVEGGAGRGRCGERPSSHATRWIRADRVDRRKVRLLRREAVGRPGSGERHLEDTGRGWRRAGRRRVASLVMGQLGRDGRGDLLRRPEAHLLRGAMGRPVPCASASAVRPRWHDSRILPISGGLPSASLPTAAGFSRHRCRTNPT